MLRKHNRIEGALVRIVRYRGEPEPVVGRVVTVRDCRVSPITGKQRRRESAVRSRYLVTVEILEGPPELEGQYRSYYHRYAELRRGRPCHRNT
jgi:hypothetical protein